MTEFAYIYTLEDPRDRSVLYVGCTMNPERRIAQHRGGRLAYLLSLEGVDVIFRILERASFERAREVERFWIEHYRKAGALLLNVWPAPQKVRALKCRHRQQGLTLTGEKTFLVRCLNCDSGRRGWWVHGNRKHPALWDWAWQTPTPAEPIPMAVL